MLSLSIYIERRKKKFILEHLTFPLIRKVSDLILSFNLISLSPKNRMTTTTTKINKRAIEHNK
jgi:hypothetical protein